MRKYFVVSMICNGFFYASTQQIFKPELEEKKDVRITGRANARHFMLSMFLFCFPTAMFHSLHRSSIEKCFFSYFEVFFVRNDSKRHALSILACSPLRGPYPYFDFFRLNLEFPLEWKTYAPLKTGYKKWVNDFFFFGMIYPQFL